MSDRDAPAIESADDPRLDGWYHTIELGDGLVTRGLFDLRPTAGLTGLPESLKGRSALDVGTANGFYAFEMEERGASPVVAVDVESSTGWDWLPQFRHAVVPDPMEDHRARFQLAHRMRGSSVEYRQCGIYELSPETVGTFDVVMCGSLLLHLQNPLAALAALRSVTRELLIVEVWLDEELESRSGDMPLLRFGVPAAEEEPGEACTYWRFTTRALTEMLTYAGFTDCTPMPPYRLRHESLVMRTVTARPRDLAGKRGWHLTPAEHPSAALAELPPSPGVPITRDGIAADPAISPLLAATPADPSLPSHLLIAAAVDSRLQEEHKAVNELHAAAEELRDYADHLLVEIEQRDHHGEEVTAYVRHLERELAAKETYIADLEQQVRRAGRRADAAP